MTDMPPLETPAAPVRAPDGEPPNAQLIVSMTIVATLGVIAGGLIVAGCVTGQWSVLSGGVGTAIGALATALNAPSGVANMLAAAQKAPRDHG